ncbi:oxidoreductase domain protein [Desulfosarcina variabilis str. Montpellier]|uniref:Gfo/Idh/MocA family protein n=1 Tax=Desulfosarcina variabilis TaxID=2300 RepID=UPI003AFA0F68
MISIGVIGCGYWGPNLVRNFSVLKGCRVKTLCDTDPHRLEAVSSLYSQVELTTDYSSLIADTDIDAVVIATPVRFHFEMALQSLLSGKHVFVEKPMVGNVHEGKILLETAAKHNLTLMVGHTFIYSPAVRKMKQIIDSGELGEIQYLSARRLNLGLFQKDINVAWDLAPHDISIILYVLDDSPLSVNCQGKAHVHPNIEDITNMVLNYHNGRIATIQSSWLDPNKVRDMTVVGSKKMLVYNDLEPMEKIKIYDKHVEIPPHYDTFAEFHYSYHYGDMHAPYIKQYEPLKRECRHFLDCIETGDTSESSGIEALKVVQVLEAASKSLKDGGGKIDIEPYYPSEVVSKTAVDSRLG